MDNSIESHQSGLLESSPKVKLPIAEAYKVEPFNLDSFKSRLIDNGMDNEEVLLERAQTDDNLLGSGGNGSVYRIPGIEGYVLKVIHGGWGSNGDIVPLEAIEDRFPELNLGQAVAHIGRGLILKEQIGIPAGVPYGEVRRNRDTGNAVYLAHLIRAANMPQSTYDQLAELFGFLNEQGISFDPSKANNLLIDEDDQFFNVVDTSQRANGERGANNLSYMAIPLLDNSYAWKVKDPNLEPELVRLRGQILAKCIQASQSAGLPLPSQNVSSLKYSFKLAGLEDRWEEFIEQLPTADATS